MKFALESFGIKCRRLSFHITLFVVVQTESTGGVGSGWHDQAVLCDSDATCCMYFKLDSSGWVFTMRRYFC